MELLITSVIAPTASTPNIKAGALTLLVSTTGNASPDVEISGLGQLFAAASTFQSQLAAIQPGAENSGTGRNFGTDFGSLAAEAQNFVDAFNQVQAGIANLTDVTEAGRFAQALNDLARANFVNGDSGVNTLAQIGIEWQNSVVVGQGATLGIDMRSLQLAFNANPSATFSLLAEAVRSFGSLAAGTQIGTDPTTISNSIRSQIVALQTSLGLFDPDAATSTPLGLASLLALDPANQGANNIGQQIAALSHFALVSSLLS